MIGRNALLVLGDAAAAGAAKPTHAQCRLCEKPTVEREGAAAEGIIALEVEAGIDFDRLILLGAGEGSATLKPDGSRQVSGRIGTISSRAMVGQATVRGEPGRSVRGDIARRIKLQSLSGGTIALEDIVTDLSAVPRHDSSGVLMFRFGGRLAPAGIAGITAEKLSRATFICCCEAFAAGAAPMRSG